MPWDIPGSCTYEVEAVVVLTVLVGAVDVATVLTA